MDHESDKVIRVGSRKSKLALIQTKHVIGELQKLFPDRKFEIHTMSTVGDRVLNISLPKIGEKSLFTKDLEDALRSGTVDFVVHSLKDLPTVLPDGMVIGAVLEREDPRDALVLNKKYAGKTLASLPEGSVIGTSSLRRTAQLSRFHPHLVVNDIRGNLNTRLTKLDAASDDFAGIILAQAGLVRMGWQERISEVLKCSDLLYAVGQGALAVECRSDAADVLGMLEKLCCRVTEARIVAERSFLRTLGGGCSAPVAVSSSLKASAEQSGKKLSLRGAVWSLDGKTEIQHQLACELPWETLDAVDEVPAKRLKVDEEPQRRSPEIINDSKASTENLDIEALINIHGDAFKRCPYSMEHQKAAEGQKKCPLHIPIGHDVMGECPFFDTAQKVDLADTFRPEARSSAVIEAPPIDKCPFLAKQIQLIEPNEVQNGTTAKAEDQISPFCGLFCHSNANSDVLTKCEELGRELANTLIKNGALEVMRKAQNEIREKA
ncbi:porphobilinogen deaminase [Phlebotomus argentipes]|uniref:porphobilinogen deaminase n=1 Tax=Phlebotomus argentipes TaxID=94469 RepID=UPI002892D91E|nr:porphobilinogen deaminase [Phlebotomus argentipes]